jgi:hypothetical protein
MKFLWRDDKTEHTDEVSQYSTTSNNTQQQYRAPVNELQQDLLLRTARKIRRDENEQYAAAMHLTKPTNVTKKHLRPLH